MPAAVAERKLSLFSMRRCVDELACDYGHTVKYYSHYADFDNNDVTAIARLSNGAQIRIILTPPVGGF